MLVQIEITTVCNYKCFYCCGRDMPQQHMPIERFSRIIGSLKERGLTINLQGEGEPFLHPQFEEILRITSDLGHRPYTITNGTVLPPELVMKYFPTIGISIDTVDEELADKIGRLNLAKVLRNLQALLDAGYPPENLTVHTVFFGQKLERLKAYLLKQGIAKNIVQPLQVKEDYRYRYANALPESNSENRFRCRFIDNKQMSFFNINGTSMPCCFIKRPELYTSRERIADTLRQQVVPECCKGCRELY